MPVSQRLEFGRREGNVLYPTAFHVHGGHQSARPAGSAEEIVCGSVVDLWVGIVAILRQDGMLMVGG